MSAVRGDARAAGEGLLRRGAAPAPDAHELATLVAARDAIAHGSKSFAAAARLLPPGVRDDTMLLYAWCRHCDDAVDGQVLGHAPGGSAAARAGQGADDAAVRLARLRDETIEVLRGGPGASPPFAALALVLRRHPVPDRWPLEHLDGFAMDVDGTRFRTLDELLVYCWRVAGVVGTMTATLMGVRDAAVLDRAADLGVAFQLTNVARDVVDDARDGRVYLPADWLAEAGVPPDAVGAPEHRAAVARVVARLLDAAEPYYASARIGVLALPPRCAWAIGTALRTYRAIGTRVRARGPAAWDARVSTTKAQKLAYALAALPAAMDRTPAPARDAPAPRTGLFTRPC